MADDPINPSHYRQGRVMPVELWEVGLGQTFAYAACVSSAMKYTARAPYKGQEETDVKKALWWVLRAKKNELGKTRFAPVGFSSYDVENLHGHLPVQLRDAMVALFIGQLITAEASLRAYATLRGIALDAE